MGNHIHKMRNIILIFYLYLFGGLFERYIPSGIVYCTDISPDIRPDPRILAGMRRLIHVVALMRLALAQLRL